MLDELKVKRTSILLGFLAIFAAFFWNELNIQSLPNTKKNLSIGKTMRTADDASYLAPVENFLKGKGFKNNLSGSFSFYMRPPGYSVFYLSFRLFLPEKQALYALKYFQVFLFGASISILCLLLFEFQVNTKVSVLLTSFYALSGIGFGFLYYTLTEAITPALMVFFVFCLVKAKKSNFKQKKQLFYLLSFCLFGGIFLTRPVLGIFALPVLIFLFNEKLMTIKKKWSYLILFGLLGFVPMLLWQIRAFQISNEIVGLHPIYSSENSQTPYRPVHQAFWEFAKSWGEEGANFHHYTDEFWEKNYTHFHDTNSVGILLNQLPHHVVNELGEKRLQMVLRSYRLSILEQRDYQDKGKPIQNFQMEKRTIEQLNLMTASYRKNHFWFYHFGAPFLVFKKMIFHSNLSLYIFQKKFRGALVMETWRTICFVVHSLAFLLLPILLFMKRISKEIKWVVWSLVVYLLYLIYFQRGIEERYTLPILPLLMATLGVTLSKLVDKLGPKNRIE